MKNSWRQLEQRKSKCLNQFNFVWVSFCIDSRKKDFRISFFAQFFSCFLSFVSSRLYALLFMKGKSLMLWQPKKKTDWRELPEVLVLLHSDTDAISAMLKSLWTKETGAPTRHWFCFGQKSHREVLLCNNKREKTATGTSRLTPKSFHPSKFLKIKWSSN